MPALIISGDHVELLKQLEARRAANKTVERKNNASLRAGSPMYFYCAGCGAEIVVPEGYRTRPEHCPGCLELKNLGLLLERQGQIALQLIRRMRNTEYGRSDRGAEIARLDPSSRACERIAEEIGILPQELGEFLEMNTPRRGCGHDSTYG